MPPNVDRVPPEILSIFFMLVKRLASSNSHRSGVARVNAEINALIKLSRVCRHWRRVILGDGTLWTDVPIDTARESCTKFLRSVLERSKESTVSVTASILSAKTGQTTMKEVMEIFAESSNRIADLVLDIDSTRLLREWTSPASALRKLRINNRGPCLPLTIMFAGQIPQLESLTLSGFTGCPTGYLGNLKHLTLKLSPGHPPVLTTTIVNLLTAAPNVEVLSLASFLFVIEDSSPFLKATLPRLRNVLLRRCNAISILPRIVIPKEAELHISVDHRPLAFGVALHSVDRHILLPLPPFLDAHLVLPVYPKLIVEVGEELDEFVIGLTSTGSTKLCLKVSECSGQVPLDFVRRSLEAISRHPYLKTARDVTISIPPTVSGIAWSKWFKRFALATQLSIRALPAEAVLSALMRTDEDGLPVCPCLKRVGFYGVGLGAKLMDSKSIPKLFLFRIATGFSLETVTVTEGGVIKGFKSPVWLVDLLGSETDKVH